MSETSEVAAVKTSKRSLLLFLLGLGVLGFVGLYLLFDVTPNLAVAKRVRVKADLTFLRKELADYRTRHGVYPENAQLAQELGLEFAWARDSWGSDYVYRYPGKRHPLTTISSLLDRTEYPTRQTMTGANSRRCNRARPVREAQGPELADGESVAGRPGSRLNEE